MMKLRKILNWSFILIFTTLGGYLNRQILVWGEYGVEASYWQFQMHWGNQPLKAKMTLGKICNSLKKYNCSVELFNDIVQETPNHRASLGNLAVGLAQLSQWKQAEPHFAAYFSLGGQGFDAMYWYGRTLAELKGVEAGLDWYYFTLRENSDYLPAIERLVTDLTSMGKTLEAHSVLGSLSKGRPYSTKKWRKLAHSVEKVRKPASASLVSSQEIIHLPNLDGIVYIPVHLKSELYFMPIYRRFPYVTLNSSINLGDLVRKTGTFEELSVLTGKLKAEKVIISHLHVGEWEFKDVEAIICEACPNRVGQSLLKNFDILEGYRFKTRFLSMKPKSLDLKL